MTIQERILEVIEYKGITPYRFCKDLNLSMGYLDKRGAIGTDKYLKIIEYLDEINPIWLLTGEGMKYKNEQNQPSAGPTDDKYVAMLEENNELLKKNNCSLEKINTLQEEITQLRAEIQALKSVKSQSVRVNQPSQSIQPRR